jgi:hypothetical protein
MTSLSYVHGSSDVPLKYETVGRAFAIVLGNLRHHKYGNGLTTVTASVQKRCLDEYEY